MNAISYMLNRLGLCGRNMNLIVLGFNDTSTLAGHFVSSLRERKEKGDSSIYEKEGQRRKRNKNDSKETEELETFPSSLSATRIAGLAQL